MNNQLVKIYHNQAAKIANPIMAHKPEQSKISYFIKQEQKIIYKTFLQGFILANCFDRNIALGTPVFRFSITLVI
ncbi:MAG TPA: hypothetical protein QGI40_01075, partial [Nitrospinaceae bacterium]|nr:hypothetical protein [Nitrospinaceae bacterium]